MILTLTPPLTHVKGGIKYLNGFALHLIPVKGEVKHVNTFVSSFDAACRGIERHHGFGPKGLTQAEKENAQKKRFKENNRT